MRVPLLLALVLAGTAFANPEQVRLPFSDNPELFPTPFISDLKDTEEATRILRGHDAVAVFFYDSMDLNSIRAVPAVMEVSNETNGFVRWYAADVRLPELAFFVDSMEIQYVPEIIGFRAKRSANHAAFRGTPLETLHGPRMKTALPRNDFSQHEIGAASVRSFALALLNELHINRIEEPNQLMQLNQLIKKQDLKQSAVILLTEKISSSALYKALSAKYIDRLVFFEIPIKRLPESVLTELKGTLKAEGFPSLSVIAPKQGVVHYNGEFNIGNLTRFLDKYALSMDVAHQKDADKYQQAVEWHHKMTLSHVLLISKTEEWTATVSSKKNGIVGLFLVSDNDGKQTAEIQRYNAIVRTIKSSGSTYQAAVTSWLAVPMQKAVKLTKAIAKAGYEHTPETGLVFLSIHENSFTFFPSQSLADEQINTDSIAADIKLFLFDGSLKKSAKNFAQKRLPSTPW